MLYIPPLLSALTTIQLAVAAVPERNPDESIRLAALQVRPHQIGLGRTYITLLANAKQPHRALVKLMFTLRPLLK